MVLQDGGHRQLIIEAQELDIPVELHPPLRCEPGLDGLSLIEIEDGRVHVKSHEIPDLGVDNGSGIPVVDGSQGGNIETVISDFRQVL